MCLHGNIIHISYTHDFTLIHSQLMCELHKLLDEFNELDIRIISLIIFHIKYKV
jgi:alkyl hydroperoxide reductase subunit AhpC